VVRRKKDNDNGAGRFMKQAARRKRKKCLTILKKYDIIYLDKIREDIYMLKITDLKQLADGHGIVDIFGYCYHKEADGIRCHETDALYRWRNISPIMLDNLTII
jgi:hypothetical protein